jgi:hypothetical protein
VWLLSYNYGAKSYQVIINGYTGKIAGEYRRAGSRSRWRSSRC